MTSGLSSDGSCGKFNLIAFVRLVCDRPKAREPCCARSASEGLGRVHQFYVHSVHASWSWRRDHFFVNSGASVVMGAGGQHSDSADCSCAQSLPSSGIVPAKVSTPTSTSRSHICLPCHQRRRPSRKRSHWNAVDTAMRGDHGRKANLPQQRRCFPPGLLSVRSKSSTS